jgi:ATP-binding cassette subfamily B protein RaxB
MGLRVPVHFQSEAAECGLVCLAMVAEAYGRRTDLPSLRARFPISLKGVTLRTMLAIADRLSLETRPLRCEVDELAEIRLPAILHWRFDHFVVVVARRRGGFVVHDPALGRTFVSAKELGAAFTGVAVELWPKPTFRREDNRRRLRLGNLFRGVPGLWNALGLVLACALVVELCTIAVPILQEFIIDDALLTADADLLTVIAIAIAGIFIVKAGTTAVRALLVRNLSSTLSVIIPAHVFNHLMSLRTSYFDRRFVADVTTRFDSAGKIHGTLTSSTVDAVVNGVVSIGTLVVMVVYSPILAALAVVAVVAYSAVRVAWYGTFRTRTAGSFVQLAGLQSFLIESVRGVTTLKLFNALRRRHEQYMAHTSHYVRFQNSIATANSAYAFAHDLLVAADNVAILWVGASLVLRNEFSVGMLVAFLGFKEHFLGSSLGLVDKFVEFRMLGIHVDRLADILLAEGESTRSLPYAGTQDNAGAIEFRNVHFSYGSDEPDVLRNLSLHIAGRERVGIIGPSGCGKSTLLKLIAGQLEPAAGEVLLDGRPLASMDRERLRDLIGVVQQDDHLFAGTIGENIAMFQSQPDHEKIRAAAEAAAILPEILAMPMGFNTLIGDMGSSLSGGQRQRLVLARVLYKQPQILLLDEATSHLDIANERRVLAALNALGITQIIVSHRPETIAGVNRVIDLGTPQVVSTALPAQQPLVDTIGDARLAVLADLIRAELVTATEEQRIVSPTGQEQTWLLDLRPVLLNGRGLSAIAQQFWERFEKTLPFQICGMESACIPMLSAISLEGEKRGHSVNAFIVRKERKTSGLGREIEGKIDGTPIVVIDDLTNSSASLEKVRVVVADHGQRLARAFVVVDFQARRSLEWRKRHRIEVAALFTAAQLHLPASGTEPRRDRHRFHALWSSTAPRGNHFLVAPRSTPAFDGQRLVVGTDGGSLRALDPATGAELWSYPVEETAHKGIWSSPALAGGKILFGAYNGSLYCLEAETGEEAWRADCADWIGSSPVVASPHKLVVVGLEHATPAMKGSVAAFDLATGRKRWECPVSDFVHGSPALSADEQRVFIGTNAGELLNLETATGRLVWRYRADDAIKAAPAIDERAGLVIAGSFDHGIHLVDIDTGRAAAIIKTGGRVYTTPLIAGGRAYVGSQDKKLYVIDLAKRAVVKAVPLAAQIFAPPVLHDGSVYVGTTGGRLFGIDATSLAITDTLQLPDRIVNAPVFLDDGAAMVVPVMGNRLFAFRVEPIAGSTTGSTADIVSPVPARTGPPAALVDGARGDGLYYRIDEPPGLPVERPYPAMPSRRLLGAAAMLIMHSEDHKTLSHTDLERRIMPALLANQVRVFLFGLQPIGLIAWASVTLDVSARLRAGEAVREHEWTAGSELWIVEIIAPFGGAEAMIEKVRNEALRGRTVHVWRSGAFHGTALAAQD